MFYVNIVQLVQCIGVGLYVPTFINCMVIYTDQRKPDHSVLYSWEDFVIINSNFIQSITRWIKVQNSAPNQDTDAA